MILIYESHDARFDSNLYAVVPQQKIVLAEDGPGVA
jgi:hypothetical protein